MNKTHYKRLGDYIREVDSRNRDLAVTNLVGLTIDKAFIPSVANVIGTDLSNYKVIRREQFACSLMQVSRDGKMPIAMFEEESAIMSPAYPMFEVIDTGTLLPKYLMMWFSRSEFDREASFYAVGGVRGSLTWEDFCDLKLPIPPIFRQREIVAEYETLTRRIRLNERLISSLESAAQTLYRRTFVDNIDPDRLPPGWHTGTLGECVVNSLGGDWGKDAPVANYQSEVYCIRGTDIPQISVGNVSMPKRYILEKNLRTRKLLPRDIVIEISGGGPTQSTGRTFLVTNHACKCVPANMICSNFCRVIKSKPEYEIFVYATLTHLYNTGFLFTLENSSNGVKNLDLSSLLNDVKIQIPGLKILEKFNTEFETLNDLKFLKGREIQSLKRAQEMVPMKIFND